MGTGDGPKSDVFLSHGVSEDGAGSFEAGFKDGSQVNNVGVADPLCVVLDRHNTAIVNIWNSLCDLLLNVGPLTGQHPIQNDFRFLNVPLEQFNLVNVESVGAHVGQHERTKGSFQVFG